MYGKICIRKYDALVMQRGSKFFCLATDIFCGSLFAGFMKEEYLKDL